MSWVSDLFRSNAREQNLDSELRFHLEQQIKDNIAAGMSPEMAHREAAIEFGGLDQIKEECRDARGSVWIGQFLRDIRYAIRSLARSPGFTAVTVATFVLGIGVTTVVFNLTADTLLYSLPYPNPDQLYSIGFKDRQGGVFYSRTAAHFQAYQQQTSVFTEFAAVEQVLAAVAVEGVPADPEVASISADGFHTLGKSPVLGRGFLPDEYHSGQDHVVVISDFFWRRHFNAAPNVLGRTISIDRQLYTIVGVLPRSQMFPEFFSADIFRPLVIADDPSLKDGMGTVYIIGRLRPNVSPEQALGALSAVRLPPMPRWAVDRFAAQTPVIARLTDMGRPEANWPILVAAALLFSIACLNATNLMLMRLLGRRRELSIRLAVGGSRRQVMQLVVIESVGIALFASLIVAFIARFLFPPLFVGLTGQEASIYVNYWDWGTLGCIAGFTIVASVSVIVGPLAHLARAEVNTGLKDGGTTLGESRGLGRLRGALVAIQVAIAVVLLVGTGLMVRSFDRIRHLDLGFDPTGKVKVQLSLPSGFELKSDARMQLFGRIQSRLDTVPGVRSASFGMDSLFIGSFNEGAQLEMPDGTFRPVGVSEVSSDFLSTAGLVLKRGRWLSGQKGRVECVINETLAQAVFGIRDPIGLDLKVKGWRFAKPIVGIVGDVRDTVRSPSGMRFYIPYWMWPDNIDTFVLRLDKDPPKELADLVRRAIYEVEPRLIVFHVASINESVGDAMWTERNAYLILKGLAAIALGLTVVGCFSVMAFTVDRRMTEFGIRMALGAQSADLHRLVMTRGLATIGIGLAAGIACAVGLVRYMNGLLFETAPFDPLVYVGVIVVLMTAGSVACWLPARRAGRVDLVSLSRAE